MSKPAIEIRITNLPQIRAAFGKSPILMARELNIAIRRTVLEISRESRKNVSGSMVKVQTGRLRSSHYERFTNLQGEVGTNVKYDTFVHDGTRFMKGRPYLRKAVESSNDSANKNFETAVQRVLDSIGRSV